MEAVPSTVAVAENLADVLKMPAKRKWAFLGQIALTRDATLLLTLSHSSQDDVKAIEGFMKLLQLEAKKMAHGHVIVLLRALRCVMLDSEWIMEILCRKGLDQTILETITVLRKKSTVSDVDNTGDEDTMTCELEKMLLSTADLFEWEFFGAHQYGAFIRELLRILARCDASRGSVHTEAASVFMSMCSTNIHAVCSSLVEDTKSRKRLESQAREIAQAKSFHYQALLLELIYRIQRQLSRSEDSATKQLASAIVSSFPISISKEFAQITPKNFRDSTRQLLNAFNATARGIESLKITMLDCLAPKKRKINMGEAVWVDIGGAVLEIEVTLQKDPERIESVLKLPYSTIKKTQLEDNSSAMSLWVNPGTRLADLLEGTQDDAWAEIAGFQLTIRSDQETIAKLHASIHEKMLHQRPKKVKNVKNAVNDIHSATCARPNKKSVTSENLEQHRATSTITASDSMPAAKPRTHQATQKSNIQPSRRKKPEPQHKASSSAFEYACDQMSPPKPIYHTRSDLKAKGSTQVAVQNPKELSTDLPKEADTEKLKRRELSFAETCNKDGRLSPQRPQKRKQPSTPFASRVTAAATHEELVDCTTKRSIGTNKPKTPSMDKVAVILDSPLQDPSKRSKLALQAAVRRDYNELEQKSSTSRMMPTATQREAGAHPRQTEAQNSVNFLNPFEITKKALHPEDIQSDYSLPPQSSQSASDTSSLDYLSPGCAKASSSIAFQRKSRQEYGGDGADVEKTQPQMSFGAAQQTQYQAMQNLIEDILGVQESYRTHLLSSICDTLQTQVERDLSKVTALLQDQHFVKSESECARVKKYVKEHHKKVSTFQRTMDEVTDCSSSLGKQVQCEASAVQEHIRESANHAWQQILDSTVKKAKSHHSKRMDQAKDKLRSIENSFDTDGLMLIELTTFLLPRAKELQQAASATNTKMHYAQHGADEESQVSTGSWRDDLGTSVKESCPSLSHGARLTGFAICGGAGAVLLILAVICLRPSNLGPFAILYSLGSICTIAATMFLVGPTRQLRHMFRRYRWAITMLYLFLIAMTLFVAFYDKFNKSQRIILTFILVVLQFLAATWYALSYIPFARKAVNKFLGKRCGCGDE